MSEKRATASRHTKKRAAPSEVQFVEWLEACQQHLASVPLWPFNTTRFTYFASELCWRAPRPDLAGYFAPFGMSNDQAAQDFESAYRLAHERGDPEAIMEFAQDNREAIGREWVIRQLLEWRLSGTHDGRRLFNRFIGHYWNDQGKRTQAKMLETVKKDQAVYKDSLTWTTRPIISGLAKRHTIGQNDVKDILKAYRAAYNTWKKSRRTRIYLSLMPPR